LPISTKSDSTTAAPAGCLARMGAIGGGGSEAGEGQEEGCLDHGEGMGRENRNRRASNCRLVRERQFTRDDVRVRARGNEQPRGGVSIYQRLLDQRTVLRTLTYLDNSIGTSRSSPPELPRSLPACLPACPTLELPPGNGFVKWRRGRLGLTRRVLGGWSSISALRPKIRPLGSNGARVLCTILHILHGETLENRRGEAEEAAPHAGMQDDDGCYHEVEGASLGIGAAEGTQSILQVRPSETLDRPPKAARDDNWDHPTSI
jgi:hypothetical protein